MTHGFLTWNAAAAAALALAPLAHAQFGAGEQSAEELVPVRVYAEQASVGPGQTVHVAVAAQIARGWHIYWANPGAAGLATEVEVQAPAGFRVGKARFPRPQSFKEPEGTTFGYEREAVFFVPIEAPPALADGQVTLRVSLRFLVCKSVCLLGAAERTLIVKTSAGTPGATPPAWSGLEAGVGQAIAASFEALPRPLEKEPAGEAVMEGSLLRVAGPARGQERIAFFPVELPGVIYGKATVRVADDRFTIEVPLEINPQNMLGLTPTIRGLVALGERPVDPSFEFDIPLPGASERGGRGGSD
jgi:thiol:disulfide interchange protein DsbD